MIFEDEFGEAVIEASFGENMEDTEEYEEDGEIEYAEEDTEEGEEESY